MKLAAACASLSTLHLRHCCQISPDLLEKCIEACPALTSMLLDRCDLGKDGGVKLIDAQQTVHHPFHRVMVSVDWLVSALLLRSSCVVICMTSTHTNTQIAHCQTLEPSLLVCPSHKRKKGGSVWVYTIREPVEHRMKVLSDCHR